MTSTGIAVRYCLTPMLLLTLAGAGCPQSPAFEEQRKYIDEQLAIRLHATTQEAQASASDTIDRKADTVVLVYRETPQERILSLDGKTYRSERQTASATTHRSTEQTATEDRDTVSEIVRSATRDEPAASRAKFWMILGGAGVIVLGAVLWRLLHDLGLGLAVAGAGAGIIALAFYPWVLYVLLAGAGVVVIWRIWLGREQTIANEAVYGTIEELPAEEQTALKKRIAARAGRKRNAVKAAVGRAKRQLALGPTPQ